MLPFQHPVTLDGWIPLPEVVLYVKKARSVNVMSSQGSHNVRDAMLEGRHVSRKGRLTLYP